jgi:hypothetical protein
MIESLFGQRIEFFIGRYRYIVMTYNKCKAFFKMLLKLKLLKSIILSHIVYNKITFLEIANKQLNLNLVHIIVIFF